MSGPCSTPGSAPFPTASAATRSLSPATNASAMPSCTRKRLVHTQVCPVLRNFETMAPSSAASRSASSNTRKGALPPSSSERRFTVGAHRA